MKIKPISIIIILLILMCGCKNNPPSEPEPPIIPQSEGLVPLKAGNQWKYNWYWQDRSTGEIVEELTGERQMGQVFEYLQGSRKGTMYEGFVWTTDYETETEPKLKWLYMNKPDGLHLVGAVSKSDTLINDVLYYKYPVQKGENWIVPHLVYDPYNTNKFGIWDSIRLECTDTAAIFQTPLGNFKCYVYRNVMDLGDDVLADWEYFCYFKPGFGLVGIVIKDYIQSRGTSEHKFKMILQSTNLL